MNKITKIILTGIILLVLVISTINFASALTIKSVTFDASKVSPGDVVNIEINLENNAEEDIRDVSVNLDLTNLPFAPFDSSSEFGIDEIRAEKSKVARFKVSVLENAKSEVYKIPVKITYIDENNQLITKTSLISLRVVSQPVIGVIADESLLIKSQNNEVIIRVINKGLSDIKFLEIEAGDAENMNIVSPKKIYIGDLESDDFDSVSFKVFFENDAREKMNFPVTLKYQDSLNNKYTESLSVPLNVYTQEKAIELGLIEKSYTFEITLLIVFLVLIFILYRSWRKAKRRANYS